MIKDNNFDFKTFEKPWHGQIFAITVSLSENKLFEWREFSKALANQIKIDKTEKQNSEDDYFFSWIKALENLIINKKIVDKKNLKQIKENWKDAFLATPHGNPVRIINKRGNHDNKM